MHCLHLTLPTAAENVALDEALLEEAEAAAAPRETLRLWEPQQPLVVIGRSSPIAVEVRQSECRRAGVPIVRRSSGGAAVMSGPGCLMYAVVLSYQLRPEVRAVDAAHRTVLGRLAAALAPLVPDVARCGVSDLAIGGRKFSGNSLRMRRAHLLYHGTLLYNFPLEQITGMLAMPPRQPAYRGGRPHEAFLTNLPLGAEALRMALVTAWDARELRRDWPAQRVARLVAEKYGRAEWNEQGR